MSSSILFYFRGRTRVQTESVSLDRVHYSVAPKLGVSFPLFYYEKNSKNFTQNDIKFYKSKQKTLIAVLIDSATKYNLNFDRGNLRPHFLIWSFSQCNKMTNLFVALSPPQSTYIHLCIKTQAQQFFDKRTCMIFVTCFLASISASTWTLSSVSPHTCIKI